MNVALDFAYLYFSVKKKGHLADFHGNIFSFFFCMYSLCIWDGIIKGEGDGETEGKNWTKGSSELSMILENFFRILLFCFALNFHLMNKKNLWYDFVDFCCM